MDEPIAVLKSVERIWDVADHNAFTDLTFYREHWFCTFREADLHEKGKSGAIRIIRSADGIKWEPWAYIALPNRDLRDPKFSVAPNGKLMLLFGAIELDHEYKYVNRESLITYSEDGVHWDNFIKVLSPHDWLWRVTWHQGIAYGVSYKFSNLENLRDEWLISLWKSKDGIAFEEVVQWDIPGRPNETTLRFLPSGEMIALVRRNQNGQRHCMIGSSWPPYDDWRWEQSDIHLGGPNFIIDDENQMWASGRMMFLTPYRWTCKTVLAAMTSHSLDPILVLPSDGDTSYPGMVLQGNMLWMSYFSSHEHRTSVYLALIELVRK